MDFRETHIQAIQSAALITALLILQCFQNTQLGYCATAPNAPPALLPQHKDNYFLETTLGHPNLWFPKDIPIKVLIKPAKGVQNFQPYQIDVLKNCLKEYESVSGGKIRFNLVDKAPYDILVQFSYKIPPGANRWDCGWTTVQTSPHHIDKAAITILTHYKPWLEKEYLRETCLHELGHALGMHNHSPDPHDVMYAKCMIVPQILTIRDVNTLGLLYDFKPSDEVIAKLPEYCEHVSTALPRYMSKDQADAYCKRLSERLNLSKWIAKGTQPRSCDISLLLDAGGNIYNYRVTRRSGSVAFDNSVLTALVTSIPLPKPPDGILSKDPAGTHRIILDFACSSDAKVIALARSTNQDTDIVPCAQAVAAQPLYSLDQALSSLPPAIAAAVTTASSPASPSPPIATKSGLASKEASQQLDDLQWSFKVKQLAKDHWQPDEPGYAVFCLGIKPDGKLAHLVVKQSLADAAFEKAAMDSCLLAEPYPPPPFPPGAGDFVKEVEITFDGSSSP